MRLTPAERRVLQLAADGLSDRQIARRLGVCTSAPSMALLRVYAKLGLRGRGCAPKRRRAIWLYFTGEALNS